MYFERAGIEELKQSSLPAERQVEKIEDAPKKDAKVEHDRSQLRQASNVTLDFFSDVISGSEEIAEELVFYDGYGKAKT